MSLLTAGYLSTTNLRARLVPAAQAANAQWDAAISALGLAVAGVIDAHLNRTVARKAGHVFRRTADTSFLSVPAFPLETVTSLTLVSAATETGAADASGMIIGINKDAGIIHFGGAPGDHTQTLVCTYTGGFWLDDGGTQPSGSTALPEALLGAFVLQCQVTAEATGLFRAAGLRRDGDDTPGRQPAKLDLAPLVAATLAPFRRYH